jgi:hypothetical protein
MNRPWVIAVGLLIGLSVAQAHGAVIPIFVVAGQSNATGFESNAGLVPSQWQTPQPNVLYTGEQDYTVNWNSLTAPTEPGNTARIASQIAGFGPELTLGQTISNALPGNPTVGIVKYSVNGSNLANGFDNFNPGWAPTPVNPFTHSNYYTYMRDRVTTALTDLPLQKPGLTGQVAGFFWMQGEADAQQGRTTAQYQQDLTNFIAQVRADFNNPTLPFIFGLINNADTMATGSGPVQYSGPGTAAVRQAQMNVAATVPNTYLVNTDSFERMSTDIIHFDSVGEMQLGTAFANAFVTTTPEPTALAFLPLATLLLRRRTKR